jgi:hypothetical protein
MLTGNNTIVPSNGYLAEPSLTYAGSCWWSPAAQTVEAPVCT